MNIPQALTVSDAEAKKSPAPAKTAAPQKQPEKPKKKPRFAALRRFLDREKGPKPLWKRWWFVLLCLALMPPAGIPLLWIGKKRWPLWLKAVLSVLSIAILVWACVQSAGTTI